MDSDTAAKAAMMVGVGLVLIYSFLHPPLRSACSLLAAAGESARSSSHPVSCSGACFQELSSLRSLHTLSMLDCRSLSDAGLLGIAELPALQTLIMDECKLLTDAGNLLTIPPACLAGCFVSVLW